MSGDSTPGAQPLLLSLLLRNDHGRGHTHEYHLSVQRAARQLAWACAAAVRPSPYAPNLPDGWQACLRCPPDITRPWPKLVGLYTLATSIRSYLRDEALSRHASVIIFVEDVTPSPLIALWLALLRLPRRRLRLWLLYRMDLTPSQLRTYRLLNTAFARVLRPGAFQLLTDSELLAQSYSRAFGQPLTVMPIPHTDVIATPGTVVHRPLKCWWPGEPRPEKGWAAIQTCSQLRHPRAEDIELIIAETAGIQSVNGGPAIRRLPAHLSRADYVRILAESDVILLPYDANTYRERTSGIFVESVLANKIPIVTAGTWMAYELQQHQLQALALDWNSPALLEDLWRVCMDAQVRQQLAVLRNVYAARHSESNYARVLQMLYERGPA